MSNSKETHPNTDDRDAAALLMLFQSQSTSVVPKPPLQQQQPQQHQPQQQQQQQQRPPPQPPFLVVSRENEGGACENNSQVEISASHSPVATTREISENRTGTNDVPIPSVIPRNSPRNETSHIDQLRSNVPEEISLKAQEITHQQIVNQKPDILANSSGSVPNHSRSNSGNNFSTSPGPAAAALAVDSKKNDVRKNTSNIKAMVAAAALAAAAATPFPLLSHGPQKELVKSEPSNSIPAEETASKAVQTPVPVSEPSKGSEKKDLVQEKVDVEMEDEAEEIDNILGPKTVEEDEPQTKPEESSYFTDPDSGTIGCICEYDHDDGFTIQCDRCYRWQHASCMGIKSMDEAPEFYLCYLCDKSRKVDKAKAREIQRDFLMPTSKRKRLNSMDNQNSKKNVIELINNQREDTVQEDDKRRKSSTSTKEKEKEKDKDKENQTSTTGRGRKGKAAQPRKEYADAVDDTEFFTSSKDGYKTVYFPLTEPEYRDNNTKYLLGKLVDLITNKSSPFSAVTDHTEAELKKMLSKSTTNIKLFGENVKMKFPGFSRFSVNIENNATEDDYVMEILGEIQLKQDYIDNPFNHYNIWGVAKPKVFFIPSMPFVVDARYSGNEGRFLRRSCTPSCELKVAILNDEKSIHFVVAPLKSLKPGQELTILWDWDPSHPIHKIINGKTFDQLAEQEKPVLVRSIETVLNGCECACSNNNDCYLYKVRKLLAYLYRSTRKVNIPTFGNNLSKYADIYRQRDESYYIPIKERLDERHKMIMSASSRDSITPDLRLQTHASGDQQEKISPDERREFVFKKKKVDLSDLSDELIPYKYRISKIGTSVKIPKSHDDTNDRDSSKIDPSRIESYLIPIPIIQPSVPNRVLSILSSGKSLNANTLSVNISDSQGLNGAQPAIKKKMSLKDYMKSKKK